jgi:hypothetical protein
MITKTYLTLTRAELTALARSRNMMDADKRAVMTKIKKALDESDETVTSFTVTGSVGIIRCGRCGEDVGNPAILPCKQCGWDIGY